MRTEVNFEQHVLKITKVDGMMVHDLCKPNTITDRVMFINTNGIMAVTGDYGNWIFCREFHPSNKNSIDGRYWAEKLCLSSTQDPYEFDVEAVREEVSELKENHELTEEEIEWLDELVCAAEDGEYSFIAKAMDRPNGFEAEMIPRGKKFKFWFEVILDAFDEICKRIKEQK